MITVHKLCSFPLTFAKKYAKLSIIDNKSASQCIYAKSIYT